MFRHSIKQTYRSIKSQKLYALVSVVGLAVGLTCFFTIFAYIQHEKSYDRFFKDSDKIVRLLQNERVMTSYLLRPTLEEYLPESSTLTAFEIYGGDLFSHGDVALNGIQGWQSDNSFFDVFSFEFIKGDPETALQAPHSLVLTASLAQRLFGDRDPLGKIVNIDNNQEHTVTAVIQDVPTNCHMQFEAISSWPAWKKNYDSWGYYGPILFIKNSNAVSLAAFETILDEIVKTDTKDHCKKLELQSLLDIHLHSQVKDDYATVLPHTYILLFAAIAILILLISCINIINITTAQRLQKREQVGVCKIFYAGKGQLMWQFLAESFILAATSLVLAILLMQILNPLLQNIIQINYQIELWSNPLFYIFTCVILVITTLLSGLYPAWLAARTEPLKILGKSAPPKQKYMLRTILVTAQFTITIGLLTTLGLMRNQLYYINNKNIGFQRDNIYVIKTPWSKFFDDGDYKAFKNRLLQHPNIVAVSHGQTPTIAGGRVNLTIFNQESGERIGFKQFRVADDFLQTMEFELIEGRFFSRGQRDSNATIITESAAKALNWKNPIGKKFPQERFPENKEVIGVIKDFNYFSLHEKQLPSYIELTPKDRILSVVVKLDGHADFSTIKDIEKTWKTLVPAWPMDGCFLNTYIDNLYRFEVRLERLFFIFTVLSLFLSCLGLLGITAISTQQRTKEIGIRIVNGASVYQVISLFTRRIAISVLVAMAIASPIVWFLIHKWLRNFAYHIDPHWWMFLLAGFATLLFALLTVIWQAKKTASANPVEALRYE